MLKSSSSSFTGFVKDSPTHPPLNDSPKSPFKLICSIITELALVRINVLNSDAMRNHVSQTVAGGLVIQKSDRQVVGKPT